MNHIEKHLLINRGFSGQASLIPYFNEDNNEYLLISIQTAGVYNGKKDKRGEKLAETEDVPYDWCYVYNFQNPRSPLALRFDAGVGKQFKEDMAELVQLFKTELQKAFRTEEYDAQKIALERSFDEKRDALMTEMSAVAEQHDFQVKTTNSGVFFMPVVDGKAVGEEDYDNLTEEQKDTIEKNSQMVQEKAGSIMRELRDLDKESKKQMEQLDYKTGMFAIGHHVNEV